MGWTLSIVIGAGFLFQLASGRTAVKFGNAAWLKQNKWKAVNENNPGPLAALCYIMAEATMYGLAWISTLPLPKAFGAFDFPLFKPPLWLAWTGAIIVVLAGVLNGTSRRALGAYWAPGVAYRKDHQIVTTGPYAFVRHPMYASYLLYAVGCIVVGGCGIVVTSCAALLVTAYLRRIRREERLLMRVRAQQYHSYINSTGALFPRINTIHKKFTRT